MQYIKDKIIFSAACYFLSFPYIWTEHGPLIKAVKKPPFIWFYRFFAQLSETVICVSKNTERSLHACNVYNTEVIYNGIDIHDFSCITDTEYLRKEFGVSHTDIVVSCICAVSKDRGQDIFIHAALELLKTHNNLKFFIVGNGEMLETVKKMIPDEHSKNIICTGFRKDIIAFNQLSDIIVSVSYAQGEGLPTRIIEAMACSKPVVATHNGGTDEEVAHEHTGYIIPPKSCDELCNALQTLISDQQKRIKMGENGYKKAEKLFSDQRFLKNTQKKIAHCI